MSKWDVYATVAVQIEAETQREAIAEAEKLPLEYWDASCLMIEECVGRAD